MPRARTDPRVLLAAGGAILGVFVLTRALLLGRFPLFYDEALYADWALGVLENPAVRFVPLESGIGPLFPWLGSIGMWLGVAPFTALRLISTVAGLLTIVMCGLIARDLGGWRDGLAAAGLAAIVPFFVVYDAIGILDPLATALVTTAVFLMIRLARRPALSDALLLGIVLGTGLLTDETAYSALALLPAALLVFDWSPLSRRRRLGAWLGSVAVALALAYAIHSIYSGYPIITPSPSPSAYLLELKDRAAHPISEGLRSPWHWVSANRAGANWSPYRSALTGYVTIPIVAAAVVGAVAGLRRRALFTAWIMVWFLVTFVATLLLAEVPYPRYLMVAIPPLLILAGHGTVVILDRLRRVPSGRARAAALAAFATILLSPTLLFDARVLASPESTAYPGLDDAQYVRTGTALPPYERIARDLRRHAPARPVQVVLGEFTSSYLPIEFRDEPEFRNEPRVTFGYDDRAAPHCSALYAVSSGLPLRPRPGVMTWQELERYGRPRNGTSSVLFESGVRYHGRTAVRPGDLRKLIGADSAYDRFGARHPCVQIWAEAWYALHRRS